MASETKEPATSLTLPESVAHVDSIFPEVVSQLTALVDRLTQEVVHCRRNLNSCEAALDIEKVERGRWENLYKELLSKFPIEQNEKTDARILDLERKLDETFEKRIMEMKEQLELKSSEKSEKTEAKILELERKLGESLEAVTFFRDKSETFEKKMMEMKEQLDMKSSEAALDIEKVERDNLFFCRFNVEENRKTAAMILKLERKLDQSLESMKKLRDKNETFEQKIMDIEHQLEHESKSLEDLIVTPMELKGAKIGEIKYGELSKMNFTQNAIFPSKAAALTAYSSCQKKLQDPTWNPYQFSEDGSGYQDVKLNEDDEFLQSIKQKWGDEIYVEVTETLKSMITYSPVSRLPVLELWNENENRNATLKEVILCIFENFRALYQAG